jgi:hypothetical protein
MLSLLAVVALACGTSDSDDSAPTRDGDAAPVGPGPTLASGAREDTPSALQDPDNETFPAPLIDVDELISGGPPPDGIPSIDEPTFVRPEAVDFLEDNEPVLLLEVGDDARAYPVQILIWHEIVNDVVGGTPVTVTYCPLCNSAVAFDRRLGERTLDFGTSGLLYQSALVMYDRQTESLWSHFTGQAVVGTLTGAELSTYPVSTVSWAQFRDAHPDGLVLSRKTGFDRSYGRNPYPGYDDVDTFPFLFEGEADGRLAAKTRVVGVEVDGEAVAVRRDELTSRGALDVTIAGRRMVVFHRPGTASALDGARVDDGADVGTTGVFLAELDGRALAFTVTGDEFVDDQTGTRWDVLGHAIDGPAAGARLEPVVHVDTFWFAWAAFRPDTRIVP